MSAVLDTGALIAYESGNRLMWIRIQRAQEQGLPILVPSGCVAQSWRDPARQARLAALLKRRSVQIRPLDDPEARRIGRLLAQTGTADVIDAQVAVSATSGDTIYTSDPDDLRRLAPQARIIPV